MKGVSEVHYQALVVIGAHAININVVSTAERIESVDKEKDKMRVSPNSSDIIPLQCPDTRQSAIYSEGKK